MRRGGGNGLCEVLVEGGLENVYLCCYMKYLYKLKRHLQKLVCSFHTSFMHHLCTGPYMRSWDTEMNRPWLVWKSSQHAETVIIIHHNVWAPHAFFLPPAPASGTPVLIHKRVCGEREKKKMTIVNPAKVAGLSRNIATPVSLDILWTREEEERTQSRPKQTVPDPTTTAPGTKWEEFKTNGKRKSYTG